ncbi:MAG TPA: type II secretion system protein [Chthoniobacterales bacterium]|jgi:prepilin-type N-terminal cleavage/methylation domain-containing protein
MISPKLSSRRGFTLIELLVVIAILAILMTLLFPAVQGAMETAKKTQAKNDVTQIVAAINAYVAEYGKMPIAGGGNTDVEGDAGNSEVLWEVLSGQNVNDLNPRELVFMEVPNAKSGKNGRVANGNRQTGQFLDSWNKPYKIAMDGDYDNKVRGPNGSDITKTVIAWSPGTPVKGSPNTDAKKFIKSWE